MAHSLHILSKGRSVTMESGKGFEGFQVWIDSRAFVKEIYRITSDYSLFKDKALMSQMRRAAISIISNIAEGYERGGDKEFRQFLSLAKGSAGEVRAQLYACMDLGYVDEKSFRNLVENAKSISRQLSGLMRYMGKSNLKGSKFNLESIEGG